MSQLEVSPVHRVTAFGVSLFPSLQPNDFLKNITVFKNYFFNVEKIWKKLLNSLRAHCLSIFTVSRWMDNPESKRRLAARALVLSGPLLYLLRARGLHSTRSHVFCLDPTPSHPWYLDCWERQSHWNWRALEAEGKGTEPSRQALLAVRPLGSLASGWRSSAGLGRLKPHSHFTSGDLSPQGWPQVPKKAMIQDREAEPTGWVYTKKGYGQRDFRNKFNFGFPTFSDHKN